MLLISLIGIYGGALILCSFNQLIKVKLDFYKENWYWTIRNTIVSILGLISGLILYSHFVFTPDFLGTNMNIVLLAGILLILHGFLTVMFARKPLF